MEYKYIGSSRPVLDAVEKATGSLTYTADMRFQGMLFGAILHSPYPHARIVSVDISEAEKMPGVQAVLTHTNTPDTAFNSARMHKDHAVIKDERAFPERVRYVGDRVAAVAARDRETAKKALGRIRVEYEVLPAVFDVLQALEPESPREALNNKHFSTNFLLRFDFGAYFVQ